jgi:hypothetical protein
MARELVPKGVGQRHPGKFTLGASDPTADNCNGGAEHLDLYVNREGVTILKGHHITDVMLDRIDDVKLLYCYRDIRDVAASLQLFTGVTRMALRNRLSEALDAFSIAFTPQVFGHRNVLVQSYVGIRDRMAESYAQVATHLGAQATSFDAGLYAMVWSRTTAVASAEDATGVENIVTKIHHNHIGPYCGADGYWQAVLDDEDQSIAVEAYERQMGVLKGAGYG